MERSENFRKPDLSYVLEFYEWMAPPNPTSPRNEMSRRLNYQEVKGSEIDRDHVYTQQQAFHLFQPDYSSAGNSDLGESPHFQEPPAMRKLF